MATKRLVITEALQKVAQDYKCFEDFYSRVGKGELILDFPCMFDHIKEACGFLLRRGREVDIQERNYKMVLAAWLMRTIEEKSLEKLLPLPSGRFKKIKENPELLPSLVRAQASVLERWNILKKTINWDIFLQDLTPTAKGHLITWNTWA